MTDKYFKFYFCKHIYFLIFLSLFNFTACKMNNNSLSSLPRNEELPLFDPHIPIFTCMPARLPSLDGQAEALLQEARTLESPDIYIDNRDYTKIVALTRRAAERRHWKAMLNLASLIVEGRDPPRGDEEAVRLVEAAMLLGIPAAYDRMGTYYMNGTGVQGDATRAYAFWQRAAQMGSPEALTHLGKKLLSVDDHPERDRWANESVGTKMLECAYAQGYGPAAYELGFEYSVPTHRPPTRRDLEKALLAWHNGVKFGNAECAAAISGEFRRVSNEPPVKVLHPDLARSERYNRLARILEFYPDYRFPNLDKVLPLPPADLPPWNGDRDVLINAARGISHPPSAPRLSNEFSERKGRFFLGQEYRLILTIDITEETTAPFTGYWQPILDNDQPLQDRTGRQIDPALYQVGESFDRLENIRSNYAKDGARAVRWRNWRTVRHDHGTISPPVVSGRTRLIEPPVQPVVCVNKERCPVTGTWQPWLHTEHSIQDAVNQFWRQEWLVKGQRFPDPKLDWMLDVADAEISWHLVDGEGVDLCPA
jgi:hypothetical protein